jgi:xeroderma pigmentosum group C-complementing protein
MHLSEKRLGFTLWSEIRIAPVSSDVVHIDCSDKSNICNRWIHLDVINNVLDSPTSVETFLRQRSPVSYVISCQVDGAIEDVTINYATRFSVTENLRMSSSDDLNYWSNLLQPTATSTGNSGDRFLNSQRQPMEAIPKSLSEFKSHRVYVLQSQIGQSACIIPSRKKNFVALFNGDFVYKRSDVSALKSAGSWRKSGRNVIEGQKAFTETMKRLKSGDEVSIKLFGEWQTTKIPRPTIIDGILPSNSYGNIEIWGGNENLIPEGTDLLLERRLH